MQVDCLGHPLSVPEDIGLKGHGGLRFSKSEWFGVKLEGLEILRDGVKDEEQTAGCADLKDESGRSVSSLASSQVPGK